jgi:hypothetical protein
MSSVPQNKDELISAITFASRKLSEDYSSIPDELSRTMGIDGNVKGTTISVCDTLAYLVGWGKLVLKWHSLKSQGQNVDFPDTGYKWSQLGLLAQSFQKEYQDWDFSRLQREFTTTTQDILLLVDSLNEHALYGVPWYDKWTFGRMIQFNTSSPMKNVRTKVRRFKKCHGIK